MRKTFMFFHMLNLTIEHFYLSGTSKTSNSTCQIFNETGFCYICFFFCIPVLVRGTSIYQAPKFNKNKS